MLVLFGDYKGVVKENGFYWVNPFFSRKKISLRARNFDSEKIKVNDKVGNPIQIGVILVWQVKDTFKAAFTVNVINKHTSITSSIEYRSQGSKLFLSSGIPNLKHVLLSFESYLVGKKICTNSDSILFVETLFDVPHDQRRFSNTGIADDTNFEGCFGFF